MVCWRLSKFQSPRGDFGFLKASGRVQSDENRGFTFQSPRGDFGFLKLTVSCVAEHVVLSAFQSPRRDFGFLKKVGKAHEVEWITVSFNPLAGILVF